MNPKDFVFALIFPKSPAAFIHRIILNFEQTFMVPRWHIQLTHRGHHGATMGLTFVALSGLQWNLVQMFILEETQFHQRMICNNFGDPLAFDLESRF